MKNHCSKDPMQVTWLGHACILVQTPQASLLTDPWLVDPCLYDVVVHSQQPGLSVHALPEINVLCITHPHYDHFDPNTLRHLPKTTLVIIPPSPIRRLEQKLRSLGFTRIQPLSYWRSIETAGMKVTVVPSQGIPEECGFIIQAGDSTIFHAADSIYGAYGRRLSQFNIDVAFLPFSGWEVSGVLGIDPNRQWQPDWEETARLATSTGARYVVPASCDQFWAPPSLQWLNNRIHPGQADDFVKAIDTYRTQNPQIKTQAVVLSPGSSWSKSEGFTIAPIAAGPVAIPDPPAPSSSIPLEEVLMSARQFVATRRPQVLACWKHHLYGLVLLLASRYTFYLWDIDCYLQMHLLHPKGVYPLSKPPQKTRIELTSKDAYDLFAGKIDAEILVMGARAKITGHKTDWDLLLTYALEYLFVKDNYSELAV